MPRWRLIMHRAFGITVSACLTLASAVIAAPDLSTPAAAIKSLREAVRRFRR